MNQKWHRRHGLPIIGHDVEERERFFPELTAGPSACRDTSCSQAAMLALLHSPRPLNVEDTTSNLGPSLSSMPRRFLTDLPLLLPLPKSALPLPLFSGASERTPKPSPGFSRQSGAR